MQVQQHKTLLSPHSVLGYQGCEYENANLHHSIESTLNIMNPSSGKYKPSLPTSINNYLTDRTLIFSDATDKTYHKSTIHFFKNCFLI